MRSIISFALVLIFFSCSKNSDIKTPTIVLDIKTNHDTLYSGERFYGKTFTIINGDTSNKIDNIIFYFNNIKIPSLKDTATFTFIVGDSNSLLKRVDYELKAIYKVNNKIDSSKIIKSYWLSHKMNHKRAEGIINNNKRDGLWKFWYDDKHNYLSKITMYKNGLKNGYDSTFYSPFLDSNNKLCSVEYYENNLLNGESVEYWENGNLLSKSNYKNNQMTREVIRFNSAGEVVQ